MMMNPADVAHKRFVVRWRGYDPTEVEAFLRAVADQQQRLIERLSAATVSAPSAELAALLDRLDRTVRELGSLRAAPTMRIVPPAQVQALR